MRLLFLLLSCALSHKSYGLDIDLNSVRSSFSKPQTFHSLVYASEVPQLTKINYELKPLNNERFGIFLDLNGLEIGYAFDFINDDIETKTQDFVFSYKSFKHSKITLNYQVLDGFKTNALNILAEPQEESQFLRGTKSTKVELLGLHNFHTFFGKSLFDHFFLNRPKLSQSYQAGLSLVGGWSYKKLKLDDKDSLIFTPSYVNAAVPSISEIDAESISFSAGPMLSMSFDYNTRLFIEAKLGSGYFRNLERDRQLKRSGREEIYSVGGGVSWTSPTEKTLFVMRAWMQRGRHVDTFFGDASVIYFFNNP